MKAIKKAIVLKPIPIGTNRGHNEPMPQSSKVILDKSYPVSKREHEVLFQQGIFPMLTVGDRCYSISTSELLQFEKDGIVKLIY